LHETSQVTTIKEKIFQQIVEIEKLKNSQAGQAIKYAGPVMDEKEIIAAINSIIDGQITGWFGLGAKGNLFEKALSEYLGLKYSVFTNSGSSSNLLAVASLVSLGLVKPGDEVITPATTFPTTINPLLLYGLKPCFVDIELPSYTIDLEQLADSITKRTKLIMIPHLNGSANDMETIMKMAKENDMFVIEDCCDAFGSKFNGKYVGTFGNLSTCSFYVAHHFTTGEGGAVVTNSKELHDTARSLRDWGRAPVSSSESNENKRKLSFQKSSKALPSDYESRYTYVNIGYNLKPLDLQGAIGIEQLKKIDNFTKTRKDNCKFFYDSLEPYSNSLILPQGLDKSDNSWFVFPITISNKAKFKRKDIIEFLEKRGIETRPILAGNILKHPAYSKYKFKQSKSLMHSDIVLKSGFFIGVYPSIKEEERNRIIEGFSDFFRSS
jgi:CDP-6-deoxy-D-xylo-4-hexulose-3-dehydrase